LNFVEAQAHTIRFALDKVYDAMNKPPPEDAMSNLPWGVGLGDIRADDRPRNDVQGWARLSNVWVRLGLLDVPHKATPEELKTLMAEALDDEVREHAVTLEDMGFNFDDAEATDFEREE